MKYFYLLINDPNISDWTLVNRLLVEREGNTQWYFPDILYCHPFDESSLTLTVNDPPSDEIAQTLEKAFKALPPHRIVLLRVNANHRWQGLFTQWKAQIEKEEPSFFTDEETAVMEKTATALRLTASQKTAFSKACIARKLRHKEPITVLLTPYTNIKISIKKERSEAFDALLKRLWQ